MTLAVGPLSGAVTSESVAVTYISCSPKPLNALCKAAPWLLVRPFSAAFVIPWVILSVSLDALVCYDFIDLTWLCAGISAPENGRPGKFIVLVRPSGSTLA